MADASDPSEPVADLLRLVDQAWPAADWCEVNVAVALSGGGDSVGLLRAVDDLKSRAGGRGRLLALHVNHQLRGAESDADAAWCRQQCERLAVPLQVLTGDPQRIATQVGDGLEAAARAERYRLLSDAAEQAGVRYLAMAHTREDQVETILFRLLRGAGLRGLSGIPAARPLTPSLTLVRPLLDCSRAMLAHYLKSLNQEFCVDSSNDDRQFARNRIRLELLPSLRAAYNADLDSALLGLASQAAEAQRLVETEARELLTRATIDQQLAKPNEAAPRRGKISLTLPQLRPGDSLVLCEALRIVWREAGLPERDMTRPWWLRLAELAAHVDASDVLNLPGAVRASKSSGVLLLEW